MYKRHILLSLVCLLAMIPIGTRAQQLTGYEYWFDGDLSTIVEKSLSGNKADIIISVETQNLSDGLHTLYFRAKQSDGYYSPITSSVFFKHNVEEGNQIEYWFDDRYEDRATMDLPSSASEDLVDITFDMQDNEKFPIGLHQLNMRMATEGKSLNSVYSAWVLKLSSGEPNVIEYWVDDNNDKEHRRTVTGHKASSEDSHDYVFVNPFDLSGVSPGLHRIYYRAISENGGTNSAVYMTTVTVSCGTTPTLEYWIDDDGSTLATVSGHDPSSGDNGTIFSQTLDLSKVSPGAHRLNYRAVDAKGIAQTAISSTPILVKSKYNINPEDVEITHLSIAVDDETPKRFKLSERGHVVDIDHPIDLRDLSKGSHQLKLKLENSLGAGVNEISDFKVEEYETPTITISAEEKNGFVNLKFNSIPNDVGYRIFRIDANGVKKIIKVDKVSHYPNDVFYTDDPSSVGTFKYFVHGVYSDITGERHRIESNETTANVTNVQREYGYIEGEIYYDGKRKVNFSSDITFSDNGMVVKSNDEGVFRRDKVPVGTELTVSLAQNDKYVSEGTKLKVVKGRNKIRIDAIKRFEFPVNDELEYGNLAFVGEKKYEPGEYLKLTVNNSTRAVWRGKLCVKVIAQSCDKDEDVSIGFNDSQVLPGSVAPFSFSYLSNYQVFFSDEFELGISKENATKEVTIPLDGIYNNGPTEMFNFYVKCIKDDGTERLVVPNFDSQTTRNNPLEILLEGGVTQNNKKVEFFTNLIVYLCSTVKEVDDITGKASKILGIKEDRMKNLYNELTYKIEHAKSDEDLMNDVELQKVIGKMIEDCDKYKLQTQDFRNRIAPIVKETNSFLDLYKTIKKSIDAVKDFKEASAKTDCQKAVYLAKKYLSLYDDGFAKILKSYIDITAAIVNKIHYLSWAYNEPQIPMDMFEHHLRVRIKILNKKGNAFNYFTKSAYIIDKVLIKGYNQEKNGAPDVVWASLDDVDTSFSILNPWHEYATFSQVNTNGSTNADDPNGYTSGDQYRFGNLKNEAFKGLWAEIYWRNGRVSYIPLTETDTEGVSYERNAPWSIFTITFKADTTDYSHAADIIHLVE